VLFCNERPEGFVFDKALPDIWFYSAPLACSELPLGCHGGALQDIWAVWVIIRLGALLVCGI